LGRLPRPDPAKNAVAPHGRPSTGSASAVDTWGASGDV